MSTYQVLFSRQEGSDACLAAAGSRNRVGIGDVSPSDATTRQKLFLEGCNAHGRHDQKYPTCIMAPVKRNRGSQHEAAGNAVRTPPQVWTEEELAILAKAAFPTIDRAEITKNSDGQRHDDGEAESNEPRPNRIPSNRHKLGCKRCETALSLGFVPND